MSIYNQYGTEQTDAYGISGVKLSQAYDINDQLVLDSDPDIPVIPAGWTMSESYKAQVLDAMDYIKAYLQDNDNAFAFAQFNDVHQTFGDNEPNFIDFNKGYKYLAHMMFLGDMTNLDTDTDVANLSAYINAASVSKKLMCIGNHDGYYTGQATNPETLYKSLTYTDVTYKPSEEDALIYYYDDAVNGVRYIILNYYNTLKSGYPKLDIAQAQWCASVMSAAGGMDIIIGAHGPLMPWTNVTDSTQSISQEYLPEQDTLVSIINAFQAKSMITIGGTTYDFSTCNGDFIMYTCGHWHCWGYGNDNGFNMFVGPSKNNPSSLNTQKYVGFMFFIVDKASKQIINIMCNTTTDDYFTLTCSYDVNTN